MMDNNEGSLRSKYETASSCEKDLDHFPDSNGEAHQERLRATIAMYRQCKDVIAQMSLFSANESLEDVATSEMRWVRGIYLWIG
jgi:hypothetical protein